MPLSEARRFRRAPVDAPAAVIEAALETHAEALNGSAWMYCGYAPLPLVQGIAPPAVDIDATVDNQFRLGVEHGFETCPAVVTTSLRTSRFAPVLFWEVLHVLAVGGLWIDVEDASRCDGTALAEDFPDREYFRESLTRISKDEAGPFVVQAYRKVAPTPLAANIGDAGWTFGILTAGSSEQGGRMAADILALDLPGVEVIFCGPRPADAPSDPRVRTIDLDRPEPRGWITRKKNLIVDAAKHENVCLLHDRFRVTPDWADALRSYGACFSVLTFPQVFAVDKDRRFTQRYADYQVLFRTRDLQAALEARGVQRPGCALRRLRRLLRDRVRVRRPLHRQEVHLAAGETGRRAVSLRVGRRDVRTGVSAARDSAPRERRARGGFAHTAPDGAHQDSRHAGARRAGAGNASRHA